MTVASPPASSQPSTPSRRRRSLRLDSAVLPDTASPSPYTSGTTNGTSFSRRSSRTSQTSFPPQSPVTPRPMSSKSSRPPSFSQRRVSGNSTRSIEQFRDSGLGNLADELEDAWDDDEGDAGFLDGLREGEAVDVTSPNELQTPHAMHDMHDFGIGMAVSDHSAQYDAPAQTLALPQRKDSRSNKKAHQRNESIYDGSDYGPDSDGDEQAAALPPILRKRICDIEKLTRECTNPEDAVSEEGGTVKRTLQALKELGPQANVEYGVTRLITAYTSMASHRTHTTRDFFTQSHSLLYGGVLNLPEELIDLLLDEVKDLVSTLPFLRQQNPLLSLQILASQTDELQQTLRALTDLLQESRHTANAATRKLKSVRDMVEDMAMEEELVDNSIMLIQAGDWDRRCRTRQAAKTCREICEGFGDRWDVDIGDDWPPKTSSRPKTAQRVLVST